MAEFFALKINLSDDEVTALLDSTYERLKASGEYDQGLIVGMEYDDLMDIVIVARTLWERFDDD